MVPELSRYDANSFIESELARRLVILSDLLEADMLAIQGLMGSGLDDIVHRVMEDDAWKTKGRKIGIVLTTDGGYVEVVHRIAETIRHHYSDVSFIVPDHAYSAGTILVMSGDRIFMDYYSRLGPIDPQVETGGKFVPALGYLKKWERLLQKAQDGTITVAEIQLMLQSFDQAELYMFEQARELSVELLKEWLAKYKFKTWTRTETHGSPVTDEMRSQRAEEIARKLNETERWHSHGYGISLEILQEELQLKIEDYGRQEDLKEAITAYHSLFEDFAHRNRLSGAIHVAGKFIPVSQE